MYLLDVVGDVARTVEAFTAVWAFVRSLAGVFPAMVLQMRAHFERLSAYITNVFPYIIMNHPYVSFKIARTAESLPAHFAHVFPPFRSSVHSPAVRDHVREAVKDHFTLWTWVLHLARVYGVRVYAHRPGVRERLTTDLAHDFIFSYFQMYALHMLPKVTGAYKTFVAYIAQEFSCFLTLVHTPVVVLHVPLLVKQFLTVRTLVHLRPLVYRLNVHFQAG